MRWQILFWAMILHGRDTLMNRQHAVCRMFSPLWLLLISCSLFYLSATTSIIYAEDTCISTKTQKELERFLTETLSSSSLVENLLANLTANKNGRFVSASNQSGGFYSLVFCTIQQDADKDTM